MDMIIKTPLDAAISKLGVTEFPDGSNNVEFNSWYYGKEVSGPDYPWCSVFVLWAFHASGLLTELTGLTLDDCRRAVAESASFWKTLGLERDRWITSEYRAGDVVVFDWDGHGSIDHVGLAESVVGTQLLCIEGNTALGNDSNGGRVMRRERRASQINGAFRPKYTEVNDMTRAETLALIKETVTPELLGELYKKMLAAQHGDEHSAWAAEAVDFAKKSGLFAGDGDGNFEWEEPVTRQEAAILFRRFAQLAGLRLESRD
ncbi:MAG: CHAP domain-containing protein [Oscillospiraceae bacterium]|jgi:hypothetical protein|nr:CHAP domain-containing protein [Oscillospiraceae bacterium]